VQEPDLSVCGREVAFLRTQVAKYRDEPYPVKVLLTVKMLMAMLYLRGPNRDPSAAWVKRYIKMVNRKDWKKTHQHFAFDTDGLLRDGLHRVLAFIQADSNEERYGWIWFGVAPEDFAVMDTGNRRNAGQNLGIYGDTHANLTAAVIRLRHRIENKGEMPDDLLVHETGIALADDDNFKSAVSCGALLVSKTGVNKSSAVLAYWLIAEKSVRAVRLGAFWNLIVKGAGLEERSPILVCREKLNAAMKDPKFRHQQYVSQTAMAAWIIEAWNLWTNDNPVPSQKWPLWAKPHALPVMDADDSYGTGESRRVIKERDRKLMDHRGRRRTPGNVVRALGIPRG
jgi:hypothetical protein